MDAPDGALDAVFDAVVVGTGLPESVLAAALATWPSREHELGVGSCYYDDDIGDTDEDLVVAVSSLPRLRRLDLSGNMIRERGALALARIQDARALHSGPQM